MAKIELLLKVNEYDDLFALTEGTKNRVSVNRETLLKLLIDHGKLIAALGSQVVDPKRERIRLRDSNQ